MSTKIHPTALVDSKAQLGENVEIGAFSVIGPDVTIGDGSKVWHHATIWGYAIIGEKNEIFPYVSIGMPTQDLKFKGGRPGVRLGDRNTIREYTSINCDTLDGHFTEVGSDNLLLSYCHVGHGCKVGNHLIASNGATFAGHVEVEDHVGVSGGGVAVHQFCRIGRYSYIGGCSKVVQDIPPFMLGDGNPARIRMFNKVGLERAGFDEARMKAVKFLFKSFYRDGLNRTQAIQRARSSEHAASPDVVHFLDFVERSERGITAGAR